MENSNTPNDCSQLTSSYLTVSNPHDSQGYLQPVKEPVQRRIDSEGYEKPVDNDLEVKMANQLVYDEPNDVGERHINSVNDHSSREREKSGYNLYDQIDYSNDRIAPNQTEDLYEKPVDPNHLYQQLTRPKPTGPVLNDATNNVTAINQSNANDLAVSYSGNQNQPVTVVIVPTKELYKPTKYFTIMTLSISVIHIVLFVVLVCLQIFVDVHKTPLSKPQIGLILGIFSGIIGTLGIIAYKTKFTKTAILGSMIVLTIFCILFAFALLIVAPLDLVLTALQNEPNRPKGDPAAANGILILVAFLEIVLGIWSSVIACIGTCKCCKVCCYYVEKDVSSLSKHGPIKTNYSGYVVQDNTLNGNNL